MAVSLQQARQELNQSSGGSNNNEWLNSRTDAEVVAEFRLLTGQEVEGGATQVVGNTGTPPAGDVAGGYQFLPYLLQLLQQSIQSGQFQQNYDLSRGDLTGYA